MTLTATLNRSGQQHQALADYEHDQRLLRDHLRDRRRWSVFAADEDITLVRTKLDDRVTFLRLSRFFPDILRLTETELRQELADLGYTLTAADERLLRSAYPPPPPVVRPSPDRSLTAFRRAYWGSHTDAVLPPKVASGAAIGQDHFRVAYGRTRDYNVMDWLGEFHRNSFTQCRQALRECFARELGKRPEEIELHVQVFGKSIWLTAGDFMDPNELVARVTWTD